ncbi:hypothetical protein OROMI_012728 [Orobanche minor]
MGTFVRHPKIKGKRKVIVEENGKDDLIARMRSLKTMQLEIHDNVRSLRSEVQ